MLSARTLVKRLSLSAVRWHHAPSCNQPLNSLTPDDLTHFAKILPQSAILSTLAPFSLSPDELNPYNDDWMGKYHGKSTTVLKPQTTKQVSDIVRWCYERRIGIVPQGGNTGLVGGSVPLKDELIINLGNMSKVRSFDPVSGALVADAGCILESLSEYISPHNHIMPLDLGAKGSCQIGGNVATNAGGLRLLRYGSLHGTVLGLEVVLPDGTVLDGLSTLRKDNTGYDLKQLFIGAEGTLGIITGVSILTPPAPQATNNVIVALPSFANVLPLFKMARRHLSEVLSAFEFIDRTAYDLAVKHGQGKALSEEDAAGAECFVLMETSGGNKGHDEEVPSSNKCHDLRYSHLLQKLQTLLETLLEADEPLITTGVLSQSPAQFASLWKLREGVTEAVSKEGKAYKYDISIPLASFKEVVDTTREHLRQQGLLHDGAVKHVIGYGHVGDGNLHLNIIAAAYTPEITAALEPFVYELTASYSGSISAEHGLGAMKAHAIHYSKSGVAVDMMKRIKDVFDPRGIMNPGKVLEH
ncbi:FAD-binding domain-containing protein [Amylostereum chailletii]|nr:FAD-binding domain-containing protein [Amylostereum chailletii]